MLDPAAQYQAAVEQEQLIWAAAFLPLRETVCGIPVLSMTPRRHLMLDVSRNPIVCGGYITFWDAFNYLWVLRPEWNARSRVSKALFWLRARRTAKRVGLREFIEAVLEYDSEVWMDAPPKMSKAIPVKVKDETQKSGWRVDHKVMPSSGKVHFCFVVPMLYYLCPRFGKPDEILDTPYKRLFQYLKITMHEEKGHFLWTPSDNARMKILSEKNRLAAEKAKP
jgi:hypothetical protein